MYIHIYIFISIVVRIHICLEGLAEPLMNVALIRYFPLSCAHLCLKSLFGASVKLAQFAVAHPFPRRLWCTSVADKTRARIHFTSTTSCLTGVLSSKKEIGLHSLIYFYCIGTIVNDGFRNARSAAVTSITEAGCDSGVLMDVR